MEEALERSTLLGSAPPTRNVCSHPRSACLSPFLRSISRLGCPACVTGDVATSIGCRQDAVLDLWHGWVQEESFTELGLFLLPSPFFFGMSAFVVPRPSQAGELCFCLYPFL